MQDIEAGLDALSADIQRLGIRSIALPPLGAGLHRAELRHRIEQKLGHLEGVRIVVHEPSELLPVLHNVTEVPNMTAGRAALVGLMDRYLGGLLDPFVSLLEVQKQVYFLQESGEPLRLDYQQGLYGPYTPTLGKVLRRIEGPLISGYAEGGDDPSKPLTLVAGAREDAERFLADHPETTAHFNCVTQLVDGFETPYGMELLSTVHFAATRLGASTPAESVIVIHNWSDRKRQCTPAQITLAWVVLTEQGWLPRQAVEAMA